MHKIKALFFSSMFLLPMTLLTHNAFSASDNAATPVTKLTKIDRKIGEGKEAVAGKTVDVHYTGWLYSATAPNNKGTKSFPLGEGRVIKGWDQGVAGMKVGGQRTLIIPADLGYGARGAGSAIPPNAALVFDVELFGVH
jgi:FKBP-type peptidyl-prolyl cis-trans isomerase FkpA